MPFGQLDRAAAGGLEVARPADVAVRMAQVRPAAGPQQADQSAAHAALAVCARPKLDDVADPDARQTRANQRIEQGQDPVLHANAERQN